MSVTKERVKEGRTAGLDAALKCARVSGVQTAQLECYLVGGILKPTLNGF